MASVTVNKSNSDGTLYTFYFGFILTFKGFNSIAKPSQTMSDERGDEEQKLRNSLRLYRCCKGFYFISLALMTNLRTVSSL